MANTFKDFRRRSGYSLWGVDPDDVQMAEVDALFIIPAVTGAAFGPDVGGMRRIIPFLWIIQ